MRLPGNNAVMFSWEALFPLFAYTNKDLGGLGLPVDSFARLVWFDLLILYTSRLR